MIGKAESIWHIGVVLSLDIMGAENNTEKLCSLRLTEIMRIDPIKVHTYTYTPFVQLNVTG